MIADTELGPLAHPDRPDTPGEVADAFATDVSPALDAALRDGGSRHDDPLRDKGLLAASAAGAHRREAPARIVLRGWQHPTVSAGRPDAPGPAQPAPAAPALAAPIRGRSTRTGWTAWLPGPRRTLPELAASELAASGHPAIPDSPDNATAQESRAVAPFLDADHYLAGFADPAAAPPKAEALAHFLRHGWREGRSPGLSFDTGYYLAAHPDVAREGVNPVWHYVLAGRAEGRLPVDPLRPPFGSALERAPAELARLVPFVDRAHYLATYPDVLASGDDPLLHYCRYGWREGRSPSRSFHTRYYLETNPEVAARDINPLWHYAVLGQREGRHPVDRTGFQRTLLGALRTADERTRDYQASDSLSVLDPPAILALLRRSLAGAPAPAAAGVPGPATTLVLSISHDPYRRVVGGTQIFIADEEARFRAAGGTYLHLSPVAPRLRLAAAADGPQFLRLTLDGAEIGHLDAAGLAAALRALAPELPSRRLLVLHCLLGHATADVAALHEALRPASTVLWLHDYSTLCEGFNLLRNDTTFCGAPPPGSQACRVCIHGPARAAHLAQVQALFAAVLPDVVAPSRAALRVWLDGQASLRTPPPVLPAPDLSTLDAPALPARSTRVHPHARVEFTATRRSLVAPELRGTPAHPVRVAFVGHPGAHKGWPAFLDMAGECGEGGAYRFFHFADAPAPAAPAWIRHVAVQVAPDRRDATREALEAHAIDLVVMPAPWPETFSYVAHEAIASGADILALADGGNVAAEVIRSGRGVVLDDASACTDFLVSGRAVEYVRLCTAQGSQVGRLVHCGTTATLPPAADDPEAAPKPAAGHDLAGIMAGTLPVSLPASLAEAGRP